MAQSRDSSRRKPRKSVNGFVSANKRIYITDEMFPRWRSLRANLNLETDDLLALRLLDYFSLCSEEQNQVHNVLYTKCI